MVQFIAVGGKRKTVRFGKLPDEAAQAVRLHVGYLAAAQRAGVDVGDDTKRWLAMVDDAILSRLAAVGFVVSLSTTSPIVLAITREKEEIEKLKKEIAKRQQVIFMLQQEMPTVPRSPILVEWHKGGSTVIPPRPGIYFVWRGDEVVYVGKSSCLSERIGLDHGRISRGDSVSWIERSLEQIGTDEIYYIWLLKPVRNSETQPSRKSKRASESGVVA